jgi:hypothetical protein
MSCGYVTAPLTSDFPNPGVRDADVLEAMDWLPPGDDDQFWVDEHAQSWVDAYDWGLWSKSEWDMVLLGVADGRYGSARFLRDGEGWRGWSWGDCQWTPVVGSVGDQDWFLAAWWLAEDTAPEDTTFPIIAMVSCITGEPGQELYLQTIVWENPETVTVFVAVEFVASEAGCTATARLPVTVELSSPIGQRTLLDGSYEPPFEVGTRPLDGRP